MTYLSNPRATPTCGLYELESTSECVARRADELSADGNESAAAYYRGASDALWLLANKQLQYPDDFMKLIKWRNEMRTVQEVEIDND